MEELKKIALKHNIEYIACLPFKEKEGFSSVVIALIPYYAGEHISALSKYTRGRDYHKEGRDILSAVLNEWGETNYEILIDVSPFNEKQLAYDAGLGYKGKNGLIITEKYGSYVFIATAFIKRELSFSFSLKGNCTGCNACLNACPSGAIYDGKILYEKCLSYITQKRQINEDEEALIKKGGKIWGCDVCQDVCPMNKSVQLSPFYAFRENLLLDITDIDSLSQKEFKRKYNEYALAYKGKSIIARNIKITKNT